MTEIQKRLSALADRKNAEFQAKLTPNVDCDKFIGVRTPQLRILAASLSEKERAEFMEALPHEFYDENMLHSVILEKWKDYGECLEKVERFLPYVDNWAVCDTLRPKVFAGHREELLPHVKRWIASDMVYTCRFGINMLMTHYLDKVFKEEYLALPAAVTSEEYYVRMMAAWYYATALAKQWDSTIPYIERGLLPPWTHNKTIQKACESYRITPEQKAYLRTLRRK